MASLALIPTTPRAGSASEPAPRLDRWLRLARSGELGKPLTLRDGRRLWNAGEFATHVYLLTDGVLEYSRASSGATSYLVVGPTLVGAEETLAEQRTYAKGARVVGEATVYAMDSRKFLAMIHRDQALGRETMQELGRRLCGAGHLSLDSALEVETKLAALLGAYAQLFGERVAGGVHVALRRSQAQLATELAVGIRSVNRVMSRWKKEGLLARSRGYLTLTDPQALCDLAGPLAGALVCP